jgi:hypothetical protein
MNPQLEQQLEGYDTSTLLDGYETLDCIFTQEEDASTMTTTFTTKVPPRRQDEVIVPSTSTQAQQQNDTNNDQAKPHAIQGGSQEKGYYDWITQKTFLFPTTPLLDCNRVSKFLCGSLLLFLMVAEYLNLVHLQIQVTLFVGPTTTTTTTTTTRIIPILSSGTTIVLLCLALAYYFLIRQQQAKQQPYQVPSIEETLPQGFYHEQVLPNTGNTDTNTDAFIPHEEWGKKQQQQHECRCQVSRVLGSIGAPLLRPSQVQTRLHYSQHDDTTTGGGTWNPRYADVIHLFAMAHAKLLHTMDIAMDILKMSTAMQLGATTATAERVERALFARERQRQRRAVVTEEPTTLATPPVVSFPTIRTMVQEAMIHQVESLLLLLAIPIEAGGAETTLENVTPTDVLGKVPSIITLTWLRESRQQVAGLLTFVMEEVISVQRPVVVSMDNLTQATQIAEEVHLHLRHALGLGESPTNSNVDNKGEGRASQKEATNNDCSALKARLETIRTQYCRLYIALWAMEDTITGASEDQKVANANSDSSLEMKDSWRRVTSLNDEICASLQEIDRHVFQEVDTTISDENEDPLDIADVSASNRGIQGYTVETMDQTIDVHRGLATKPTKTAIFSGKGAVQPHPRRPRKASEPSTTSAPLSSVTMPQNDPVAQHYLLSELRTRLQMLALPEEEHEVNDDPQDDDTPKERPRSFTKKTVAIPLFGGAMGSMLVGELNNAVKLLGGQSHGDDDLSTGEEEQLT